MSTQSPPAALAPGTPEKLRALVQETQASGRLPSVSVAVGTRDDLLFNAAAGIAEIDGRVPADADVMYRVGSITKTFTAVSVLRLRDEGRLRLDQPVSEVLGERTASAGTFATLLSHFSGLQREPPGEIWESMEMPPPERVLDSFEEAEHLLPRARYWHYSNLAYALLGEAVQQLRGKPLERVVESELIEPLGLGRTAWMPSAPHAQGYFVDPYQDRAYPEPHVEMRGGFAGLGQLWSTPSDLVRWGSFLVDPIPEILKTESAAEMRLLQSMSDLQHWTLGWGLGLELFRRGDRVFVGHTGSMPGFVACLAADPKTRVAAAVTINSSVATAMDTCLTLLERALEGIAAPMRAWHPRPTPRELDGILGRWWAEGEEFVLRYVDKRLELRAVRNAPDQDPTIFESVGADVYRALSGNERGELLRVVRGAAGAVEKLYFATYPMTRRPHLPAR